MCHPVRVSFHHISSGGHRWLIHAHIISLSLSSHTILYGSVENRRCYYRQLCPYLMMGKRKATTYSASENDSDK